MTNSKRYLLLAGCIVSHFVLAGTMGGVSSEPSPVFFEVSSGYSFPFNEKLQIGIPGNPTAMVVDLNGSPFFAAEIGHRFHPHFSVGLEAAYRPDYIEKSYNPLELPENRNFGSSPEKALTFMVNGYLNGSTYNNFTPYLTGGVGAAWTWLGDINAHNGVTNEPVFYQPQGKKTRFAWQAGAGVTYEMIRHIALDLRGRIINFDRSQSEGIGVGRPAGTRVSIVSSDYNLLKFNAFELGLGLIAKAD